MAYTRDWLNTNPVDHTTFASQPGAVRQTKVDVDERLKNWIYGFISGETETNDGFKQVPLRHQSSDPSAKATTIQLYGKDVTIGANTDVELYGRHETGGVQQLTYVGKLWIEALKVASEARGDIIARGASAWGRFAPGDSGLFLKSQGAGSDLAWADPLSGMEWSDLPDGAVVAVSHTDFSAYDSGSTRMVYDDSKPDITEGDEYMTQAHTPKSSTNILLVFVQAIHGASVVNSNIIGALFQDAVSASLKAIGGLPIAISSAYLTKVNLAHKMVAGTTSEITFRYRAGNVAGDGGIVTFNGDGAADARKLGGAMSSYMTVVEIKAS